MLPVTATLRIINTTLGFCSVFVTYSLNLLSSSSCEKFLISEMSLSESLIIFLTKLESFFPTKSLILNEKSPKKNPEYLAKSAKVTKRSLTNGITFVISFVSILGQ